LRVVFKTITKDPKLISMSAAAVAKEVEKDPSIYVKEFADIPAEYLKFIFEKLSYSSLSKFNTENYKVNLNKVL
jgi:hypothetical protein